MLELILERLDHIWVYEHDHRYSTARAAQVIKRRHEFEGIISGLFREAIDEGAVKNLDPKRRMLQSRTCIPYVHLGRIDQGCSKRAVSRLLLDDLLRLRIGRRRPRIPTRAVPQAISGRR